MERKKIGGGIIAIDIQTGDVLLGRRSYNSSFPNTWSFFGGTFEVSDGNPKITAKREFIEETGSEDNFKISSEPFYVNRDNHLDFYTYIGLFDGKFPVKLIPEESLGYCWCPIYNIPENLLPGVREMLDEKFNELVEIIENCKK